MEIAETENIHEEHKDKIVLPIMYSLHYLLVLHHPKTLKAFHSLNTSMKFLTIRIQRFLIKWLFIQEITVN